MLLKNLDHVTVKQRKEFWELAGYETRNKYEILNSEGETIAFAAEGQKGILGFLYRQFLGHWRQFELKIFNSNRDLEIRCDHPFRFFYQRLNIVSADGKTLGHCQQRFGVLTKKFDITCLGSLKTLKMRSGLFRIWSFPVFNEDREVARISKKWGGFLKEVFLDADSFLVEFKDKSLTEEDRRIILAAALFTDLQYFENKSG